jgi:hypothetical protein
MFTNFYEYLHTFGPMTVFKGSTDLRLGEFNLYQRLPELAPVSITKRYLAASNVKPQYGVIGHRGKPQPNFRLAAIDLFGQTSRPASVSRGK